jgi:hypothetical protein
MKDTIKKRATGQGKEDVLKKKLTGQERRTSY